MDAAVNPNRPGGTPQDRSQFDPALHCGDGSMACRARLNKSSRINALAGYDAILTWSDALSMVRAAFEGGGASFPSTQHRFGSPQHG